MWGTVGGGWGEVENVRRSGRVGESGLGLRLALVELRRPLGVPAGGLQFGVRGGAGWAQLRTDAGRETIDGQLVPVNQVRVGADVLWSAGLGALLLAPFGEVNVRRDSGAGMTGEGIELVAGLQAETSSVRLDVQGRMLALHSAVGYRERPSP